MHPAPLETKITKNGEITKNEQTGIYSVWNEIYSEIVCQTPYYEIVKQARITYAEYYL